MVKQIMLSNLPVDATEQDVRALFGRYGQVRSILFKNTGRIRTAYVDLSSDAEADSALAGLRNARMGSNSLNVNEARPRQE